jgi:hypothetical protein
MLPLKPGPYFWLVSLFELNEMLGLWNGVPEMVVATESYQHPSDEWCGVLNIPAEFKVIGRADKVRG